ncbi:unnamed protein product, partial [Scytosiphon promiscuus]
RRSGGRGGPVGRGVAVEVEAGGLPAAAAGRRPTLRQPCCGRSWSCVVPRRSWRLLDKRRTTSALLRIRRIDRSRATSPPCTTPWREPWSSCRSRQKRCCTWRRPSPNTVTLCRPLFTRSCRTASLRRQLCYHLSLRIRSS